MDASFPVCFETAVASTSASWLIFVAAVFQNFRTVFGRSVQQAAESAEVSTPPAGRSQLFLRVVCPTAVS